MSEKLAIDGGPKAGTNQLRPWPHFDEKAIEDHAAAVKKVVENYTDLLAEDPKTPVSGSLALSSRRS